ncbi:MFS transporter [Lactobacillus paragasseri]|uniref:MFS transporter n=2 Tax=Lactobacillus paragasseri TaxID=2107999 RepID=UPI00254C6139|nr:MFS transporter [Lactobacillus paragasseri]MDK7067268.1 MFS transporter [Lactobacillus paragasseri]
MLKNLINKDNSNVVNLLIGRIGTNIADSLFYMAILWYFKSHFHSSILLSLIFIADSTIDMFSFTLGPIIDRLNIKKLLQVVTIIQAILSLLIIPLFNDPNLHLFAIIFLIIVYILSTIGSTLIYPAEDKILPIIVKKENLAKVNGIFQMSYQTLDLFLDAGATILITYLSIKNTIIISGLIFAFALLFYARLNFNVQSISSDKENSTYLKALINGWQALQKEKDILILILPFAITNLFYGISSIGLPYFATQYLDRSAMSYGGLELASSVGGLLGSIAVQHFYVKDNKLRLLIVICLILSGISIILETIIAPIFPILILLFALFSTFWISMMNINFRVLVQENFHPNLLGRINTINSSIVNCMIPIGSFLGGIIVKNLGVLPAIMLEGIAQVITAFFYLIIFIKIKH